jgi:hypothetical protein
MADSFLDTLATPQWTFLNFLDSLGRFAQNEDSFESEREGSVYEKDYSTAQRCMGGCSYITNSKITTTFQYILSNNF